MKASTRNLSALAVALAGIGMATFVTAQPMPQAAPMPESFHDSARVMSATPIYDRVSEPQQRCTTEYQPGGVVQSGPSAPVGTIAGGVIGGLIGHQIGEGRGNTAATIGGAVAGAAIGNQVDRNNAGGTYATPPQAVQRCETVGVPRDAIRGYTVVYDYRGRQFTTELPYDPGPRLDVDVTLNPMPPR